MATKEQNIVQHSTSQIQEAQKVCQRTYSVMEIAEILQISKSKAYALCKESLFKTVKIGKYVRVSKASFDSWLDSVD